MPADPSLVDREHPETAPREVTEQSVRDFAAAIGAPFDEARWFRGREAAGRVASTCPDDASCCRTPPAELAERWGRKAWPSARVHAHVFSPLPAGDFPGVDQREVVEFLERHDRRE